MEKCDRFGDEPMSEEEEHSSDEKLYEEAKESENRKWRRLKRTKRNW